MKTPTLTTPAPLLITPRIQRYAWGDPQFIPDLLGMPVDDTPWAEAWFGAHSLAPACVRIGERDYALDALIREQPEAVLGPAPALTSDGLPYLLKILAARKPLSIQVHPTRAQATEGFAREESAGIARDAKRRCYRDVNHKPEVLVALTPFDALCGFRKTDEIASTLAQLPELSELLPDLRPGRAGLRALLRTYFALPMEQVKAALAGLVTRLSTENARQPFLPTQPAYWVLRAHRELSSADGTPDRGLLFIFLLQLIHLAPGQAVFLAPGVPHSYLQGAGVELMVNSDNVLRAGLTPKHVDPEELLRVVSFEAGAPPLLEPIEDASGAEGTYAVPAAELDLRRLHLTAGAVVARETYGPQTLLALPDSAGTRVSISCAERRLLLARGQACLIPHGVPYTVEADGPAEVYLAGLPGAATERDFRGRRPTELSFGTSGLRGLVSDITDLEAYINTRGFLDFVVSTGDAVAGTPVALGGDLRPSTDSNERSILRAVARAVHDAGFTVEYCGRLPTPALAYYGLRKGWPSIMVTGSHIPFDRNGIKFNKSSGEVLKSDEAPILAAVARVRAREYARAEETSLFDDQGFFRTTHVKPLPARSDAAMALYRKRYLDAFPPTALAGLRIALYEHSAVGRELLADLLRALGAEVHPIGRSESFVAIDTEAISTERLLALQQLADTVQQDVGQIDAIVSTDGDSDRPMLLGLDRTGRVRFFGGDTLGAVVAEYLQADTIAVPVSATDAIDRHFAALGVPVVRTRIGSPWVIAQMAAMTGERRVGWEANGGFLLGSSIATADGHLEPLPTRDATLPLIAALHAAQREGMALVDLFARLPARYSRAGLLDDVPTARSRALLAHFGLGDPALRGARFEGHTVIVVATDGEEKAANEALTSRLHQLRASLAGHFSAKRGFGPLEALDLLDGIRMSFAGGDIAHVRPSGNAPQLRIYAVANTEERAQAIVDLALAEPTGILRQLLTSA